MPAAKAFGELVSVTYSRGVGIPAPIERFSRSLLHFASGVSAGRAPVSASTLEVGDEAIPQKINPSIASIAAETIPISLR